MDIAKPKQNSPLKRMVLIGGAGVRWLQKFSRRMFSPVWILFLKKYLQQFTMDEVKVTRLLLTRRH